MLARITTRPSSRVMACRRTLSGSRVVPVGSFLTGGALTQAARDYDRAVRERRGRPVPGSAGGSALRAAALRMAQGGRRPGRSEAAQVALLVAQIGRLSVSIARLR